MNVESSSLEPLAVEAAIRKAAAAATRPFGAQLKPAMSDIEYKKQLGKCGKTEEALCELGLRYLQNLILHGASTWYDWCIKHWGTKWNSYENIQVDQDTITFETAWSAPEPVMAQLARMYPEVGIEHWWADEATGSNTGYAKYSSGELESVSYYEDDSSEALAAYVFCWGENDCLYQDEDGVWHRRDCDECGHCG